MRRTCSILLLATSFAASNASAADMSVAPHTLLQQLQQAGYQDVRDIDFDDGLWELEARRHGGWWREIAVHPDTGEIYDARSSRAMLSRPKVMQALREQGYVSINKLERSGAIWNAEVRGANLNCIDLSVSGYDGTVLHEKIDSDC